MNTNMNMYLLFVPHKNERLCYAAWDKNADTSKRKLHLILQATTTAG